MKKNINILVFISVLTSVLIISFIFLNENKDNDDKFNENIKNHADVLPIELLKIDPSKIKSISIKNEISNFKIETNLEGEFYIKNFSYEIQKKEVERVFKLFSNLSAIKVASESSNKLEIYGLKEANSKITIECENENLKEFFLGINTPTNSGAYLKIGGNEKVYVIALSDARVFLSSPNDYKKD